MDETASVYDAVIAVIREMGIEDTALVRTLLMRDNFFAGRKYYYIGGFAVCMASSDVIEFYDDDGKLLRTASPPEERGLAALASIGRTVTPLALRRHNVCGGLFFLAS